MFEVVQAFVVQYKVSPFPILPTVKKSKIKNETFQNKGCLFCGKCEFCETCKFCGNVNFAENMNFVKHVNFVENVNFVKHVNLRKI